jgi:hypothetical protein
VATSGVVLSARGSWQHPHLRWWAYWLLRLGYRGRLPGWSRVTCTATAPMPQCPCGLYALQWSDDAC